MQRLIGSVSLFGLIFIAGFALMGFEMLGSRYLNPYFGSGITTWACLISVVLFAMMVGYGVGGFVADRSRQMWILSSVLSLVGAYLILVALLAHDVMESIMLSVGYGFGGTILAAVALTFLPVALLAALSPFFVRLLLKELRYGGRVTGAVYGISTMGNVLGTLVTVFVFIPTVGTSAITIVFGCILIGCGIASLLASASASRRHGAVAVLLLAMLAALPGSSEANEIPRRAPALYPEGPLWLDGRLYVAEMTAHRVSTLDRDGLTRFWGREGCGPTSVAKFTDDLLAVSCHLAGRIVFVDRTGNAVRELTHIAGHRLRSPNDIHASGDGYLFVSDPGRFENSKRSLGNVYYFSEDGSEAVAVRDLRYPNGVAFLADRETLLVSEHLGRRVWSFALDGDRVAVDRRLLLETRDLFPDGIPDRLAGPDGLRVSEDGAVFVALYGAGRVAVLESDGEMRSLPVPFKYVTSMAALEHSVAIVGAYKNDRFPYVGEVLVVERGR